MKNNRYHLSELLAESAQRITVSFVFIISLLLAGQFANAKPTTTVHARVAVERLLASNKSPLNTLLGQTIKAVKSYPDASSPAYYVVELDPSGYIIVSADDTIEPIIAFVENGSYTPSLDDPLGALVTQDMGNRMTKVKQAAATRAVETPEQARSRKKWATLTEAAAPGEAAAVNPVTTPSDIRVGPLVQSLWSQGKSGGYANTLTCYNYYTPNNDYCGCVATAMAQLMRYHQYPTTGVGTASFNITVDGVATTRALRGKDGAGGPYDWGNMPLETRSNAATLPLEQRQAIGALCADAGVAVSMSYTATSSSAFSNDTKVAMTQTFKYGNAIIGGNAYAANNNIMPNLPTMVYPNLDAGYPVFFAISGTPGGHAILGDGYGFDSGAAYYHLNMGWSGTSDSWYNLPTIPSAIGTFSYLKMCLYNVFPTGSGEIISGRVLDLAGNPISGATVTAVSSTGTSYPAVTTNANGIYAIPKLPSNKLFTITATKAGTPAKAVTRTTGTSTDYSYSTGNIWGADITLGGVSITTATLPAGTVDTPYSFTMQAINGTAPYSWSATMLPNGLTIDPLTGEIHGSPTTAGQTNAIINVTDATGTPTSDSVTLPITIQSRVATPTFAPVVDTSIGSLGVTISCATTGATIRYTLDNSDPTANNGTVYDPAVGIMLFNSATIKAYAFKTGMTDSAIA
ncbi:MAG: C10 family peptidase, partial [bacterium]